MTTAIQTAFGATNFVRTIAIGDIHGCGQALMRLLAQVNPQPNDLIITLGDYVDRGPDSRGVLDTLIRLRSQCHLVALLGNHEQMMFSARASRDLAFEWPQFGGRQTLASYGRGGLDRVPESHWSFLESCRLSFETSTHFFIHANYDPQRPLSEQNEEIALSLSLNSCLPTPHFSGKTAILGHTPQSDGKILDLGYLKCIDTDCCSGGLLTALEVTSGEFWQVQERPYCLHNASQLAGLRMMAEASKFPTSSLPFGRVTPSTSSKQADNCAINRSLQECHSGAKS